ncbi:MAG: ABC transporter ATP-binding protein/permease [Proteobacteria bacterium]|nr:ABC transporter ATP-binding protein [Desulfobacula sp.]MBU3952478.1 ABC transporter ATP-binding protein/permease [Pseudomonadota bacterium]MBU4130775.1 ABC transporter ATP-binding protein/permease [Pseudomonadota bacterium]
MKLILPYFKRNWLKILAGLLCMILVDGAQLIVPQIIKTAVDSLSTAQLDRSLLVRQCLFIVGLGLGMAILRYGWRILLMGSARDVEKGIRDDLFRHVLELDMAFFDRTKTGDIMAHATSDITHVRMAFGFGLMVLVDTVLLGGTTIAIMIWTDPKLTALAMIPMPFLVWFTRRLGHKMHAFHRTAQESFSQLTEQIRESFFGIRVIKVFNFEQTIGQKIDQASTDYFWKNLKRAFVGAMLKPLLALFFNLSTLIIIFYGGFLVMEQRLTPGELVAFLQYMGVLAWPIIAIGWMTNLFQRGMASLKRLNKLLDAVPSVRSPDLAARPPTLAGRIRFDRAGFSHDHQTPVLSNITMDILPGTRVGVTGPPGSGKTSLVHLIPRLYNLDAGQLFIDDHEISTLDPDLLRAHVAFMPQESFLFSGTLKENILMGRTIEPEKLNRIIQTCDLTATIDAMPQGLETIVGERGVTLSGGQKQRVAMARTLIVDKQIILLDDPISQLDTQTAHTILEQLKCTNPNATFIIISHRLSALAACDWIYILDKGVIAAQGRHEDLIGTNKFYTDSFQVQQFEEAHDS